MHIGYILSCYAENSHVYSIPISVSRDEARKILPKRKYIIDGNPLTKEEFGKLSPFLAEGVELGWHEAFEHVIEGLNLPDAVNEWM